MKSLISTSLFTAAITFAAPSFAATVKFVAQDSPPFTYMDGTTAKGGTVEVMNKVCAKLKWTCSMEVVPQKRGLGMVEAGDAQFIMGVIHLAEREKFLTHTGPHWTSNLAYMGIKDKTPAVSKIEDLKGHTVAGVRASAAFKKAEELKAKVGELTLVEANTYPEAFKALFEGSYGPKGTVVSYDDVGNYLAKQANFTKLHNVVIAEKVEFRGGLSKKADPKLLEDFNKALDELRKSGELKTALAPHGLNP